MNTIDEELAKPSMADFRKAIKSVLIQSISDYRKASAGKTLSRKERRGMFANLIRSNCRITNCFTEKKLRERRHYYVKTSLPSEKLAPRNLELEVIESLSAPEYWYDAAIPAEDTLVATSQILRSIVSKAIADISDEDELQTDGAIDTLNNLLLSLRVCVDDAQKLNAALDKESKRTAIVLNTL